MTVPTRAVTVDVHEADGTAIQGAVVTAKLTRADVYEDQIVDRVEESTTTAADGTATLNLFPNVLGERDTAYSFKITHPTTGRTIMKGVGIVPDADSSLTDLLGNAAEGVSQSSAEAFIANLVAPGIVAKIGIDSYALRSVVGTTDQVNVTNGNGQDGNITLSLPQSIATTSSPTFAALTVAGAIAAASLGLTGAISAASATISGALSASAFDLITDAGLLRIGASADVVLARDAANTLAQRNGASAQEHRLYKTYTDASNYERLSISAPSNFEIKAQAAGTGTERGIIIGQTSGNTFGFGTSAGSTTWSITSGNLLAGTDNVRDIGQSSANRPRHLYLGSDLNVAGNTTLGDTSADTLTINAGTWTYGNNLAATRNAGALANSAVSVLTETVNFSADPGGSTSGRAWARNVNVTGANSMGSAYLERAALSINTSTGAVSDSAAYHCNVQIAGAGTATSAAVFRGFIQILSTGGITNGSIFVADAGQFSGAGSIASHHGLWVKNLGHATSVGTAVGVRVDDFTGSTTMRALQSSISSGTGKHNLYIDGTANNAIAGEVQLASSLAWASAFAGASDLFLHREGASTLAMRNGTNAQEVKIYNTYTDTSNYERLALRAGVTASTILTEQAGSGSVRALVVGTVGAANLRLRTTNTDRWSVESSGHLYAVADNSYDIGALGATRPRSGYFGTALFAPLLDSGAASQLNLRTNNGTTQCVVTHTASAVNYAQITGAATGASPLISAQGSDTNVSLGLYAKGTGSIYLSTGSFANQQVRVAHVASAVNYLYFAGGATGNTVTVSAQGSDSNVDLTLAAKGTGKVLGSQDVIPIAVGDETTAIAIGTGKVTFRMPYAMTLTAVRASLTTAQTSGSIFTVDINEAGVSILSTKLTIDNTEKTSTTAATAAVISDTALADDAEVTIDVDQVGDGTAKGLKVYLIGKLA